MVPSPEAVPEPGVLPLWLLVGLGWDGMGWDGISLVAQKAAQNRIGVYVSQGASVSHSRDILELMR